MQAGADVRRATRHRNNTTNFSTSCHRRAVRRNKPSFVSTKSFPTRIPQLPMILIISKIFASTIFMEEQKKPPIIRSKSQSGRSYRSSRGASRGLCDRRRGSKNDRCNTTMRQNRIASEKNRLTTRQNASQRIGMCEPTRAATSLIAQRQHMRKRCEENRTGQC